MRINAENFRVSLRLGVLADVAWRLPSALVFRARISATARVRRRELWRIWAGRLACFQFRLP